jgi:transposase
LCGPTGDHLITIGQGVRGDDAAVLAESDDKEEIIARVAALDIGKAELVCCVRLPAQRGRKRLQEVSTHSTMSRSLTELANHLVELGVQRVVMEATSDYWKPVFTCWRPTG